VPERLTTGVARFAFEQPADSRRAARDLGARRGTAVRPRASAASGARAADPARLSGRQRRFPGGSARRLGAQVSTAYGEGLRRRVLRIRRKFRGWVTSERSGSRRASRGSACVRSTLLADQSVMVKAGGRHAFHRSGRVWGAAPAFPAADGLLRGVAVATEGGRSGGVGNGGTCRGTHETTLRIA
jgi:hypothetical protein